jgi:DNA mismatch repair protein MutS
VSALERRLFDDVVAKVDAASPALKIVADWLAALDALASLAHCAALRGYSRPVLDDSMDLEIDEGRHPVVEAFLREGRFVPNSLSLRGNGVFFHLITGPNMAGKSTYLRQTALIVLMAQMGSFVPAESARIGAVDRVFCRVGAQDNLARGESTFLVEMHETAQILRTATGRSLVIMDEVGRGTSTVDGLSIAQAVCEFLLDEVCARTLFATHYLELSAIDRPGFANRSMLVEDEGAIVFTRKVVEGAAAGSYGIHVARMAGVPPGVCDRADSLKAHYEGLSGMSARPMKPQPAERAKRHAQRDLFQPEDIVISAIESIPIDSITPLEALNALAALKKSISNRDSRP